MSKPKIILWDIETSLIIATTFSLYPERIPHDGIMQDWFIICGAWKELGKSSVKTTQITKDMDDRQVCIDLRNALLDADIIVHHNGDKFDIKKLNARLIKHNLAPLPPIPTVDTLKEAKRIAQFTSNRLDYLGKFLFGTGKVSHDQGMWMEVAQGDLTSVPKMVRYNKGDVTLLERIYNKLLPYMKNHPRLADRNSEACPRCGATKLQKRGFQLTSSGVRKQRCQCQSCGGWTTTVIPKAKV